MGGSDRPSPDEAGSSSISCISYALLYKMFDIPRNLHNSPLLQNYSPSVPGDSQTVADPPLNLLDFLRFAANQLFPVLLLLLLLLT